MSHATLILYFHASKLTLQNSLESCALWLLERDIREVRVYTEFHKLKDFSLCIQALMKYNTSITSGKNIILLDNMVSHLD